LVLVCFGFVAQVWAGHTLTGQQQKILRNWLAQHPEYRLATDEDCECSSDIKQMRAGYGGLWKAVPDYHPYIATGDFNGDGVQDFAAVVVNLSKQQNNFTWLVFNGPFESAPPAFIQSGLDLKHHGLFYCPPRKRPYRLLVGAFESDTGSLLIPKGRGYRLRH